MLSSSHCPYCGNPLVTQNIKADVIQCFHGPNKFPSMPPSPEISRAFKKASFGPENGCPDWEVSKREEVGISSCSSSEQQQCFVFPGAACVQEPMSSVPHSQDQSCPKHHLSPLPSGWGLPGSLAQQNSKGIYPGWGGHMPWERTVGLTALSCLSLASSSPITPFACHPFSKRSPCSFYLHFWTLSSFSRCGAQIMMSAFPPSPFPSPSQNSPDGFIYFSFRSCL